MRSCLHHPNFTDHYGSQYARRDMASLQVELHSVAGPGTPPWTVSRHPNRIFTRLLYVDVQL